ncbi:MAG: FCD domain-containing protein [Propionibacteriaceae bacterium]|nr:FCD domain-containing protein [Propionibacteriaceae bacterium]
MSEKDLLDIYAARRLLEGEALRLAHARLDQKALELGLRRVEAMVAALEAEDFARGELIHREVHFVLYEACGSAWMLRLIQILWDNSGRYLAMAPNLRPSPAAFGKEHERVINVSVNGSAEDAVSALCDHLTNTECLVRAHYYAPGLKSNSGAIVPMD